MPGQIYGHAGQLHFEICCDQANLRHLTGRAPRWVDPDIAFVPATGGRTDSVFGNAYIYLPAGTPTSTHRPSTHVRSALSAGGGASAATDHFPPDTLRVPLWVCIAHEEGNVMLATFDRHGQPIGAPRIDSRHDYIRQMATPRLADVSNMTSVPRRRTAMTPCRPRTRPAAAPAVGMNCCASAAISAPIHYRPMPCIGARSSRARASCGRISTPPEP